MRFWIVKDGALIEYERLGECRRLCRYWPIHPDNLIHFPDCGFSFREV